MRHRDETHVVIVVRVSSDAVCESGVARACALGSAQHPAVALALCYDGPANDVRRNFGSPSENDANRIAQCSCGSLSSLSSRFPSLDEFGDLKCCVHMAYF